MVSCTDILTDLDCSLSTLHRDGFDELFLTAPGLTYESLPDALKYLQSTVAEDVAVLRADVFGYVPDTPDADWPVTWVLPEHEDTSVPGGIYLHAVTGAQTRPVEFDGRIVGTVLDGPYATECLLGGIRSNSPSASRPVQARETFEIMQQALQQVGMDFSRVIRTWLYIDHILDWYDDFNPVRTDFFKELGVFDGLVPASTGIGGSNPFGAAMETSVYAVKPKDPMVKAFAIPSPLQCPALEYGSSFSRAVEVNMPDHRRVFISGTASISPDGKTQHIDDIEGQVALTFDVVAAILESRDMDWNDVTRAVAYFRHPQDVPVLEQQRQAAGMPQLPVIIADNVICRNDLLFEIEVDAVHECRLA